MDGGLGSTKRQAGENTLTKKAGCQLEDPRKLFLVPGV